jgi:hypothetical protein
MAAGPAEKLKTRIVKSWKRARKKKDRAKIGEGGNRVGSHGETGHANSTAWVHWRERAKANATMNPPGFCAKKDNGRLRVCANDHYRIVNANPPNPARRTTYEARLPGGGSRDFSAAFRPGITWPA